jgi:gliding motility-associated-like protein
LVIAYFADGAESYASNEVCAFLKKDVPIITNVSILETDNAMGRVEVKWVKPTEFDSIQYPGPYYYTVNRSVNNSSNFTMLATYHSLDRLHFIDDFQNTKDNIFFYRIDFYNNTTSPPFLIGSSDIASSVFLTIIPTDRKLILSWNEQVPWNNENYIIYRKNNGNFDSIGQTNLTTFTDFDLNNNQTYCYYIETQGKYADATLPQPLLNLSQIACETPIDNVPPCPPILQGTTDCKNIFLEWSFESTCDWDDIYMLYIYYRNDLSADYLILDSILHPKINYQITNLPSIVGCFFLMARDLVGNQSNYSNELCFDTDICDKYRLPNVFTPNANGVDYFFRPFPYDYVESVNMHIYNRWGELVFKTTNPDILWDGVNQFTKQPCVSGVYFYVCDVNEYTLNGIRTRHLNGSVTILR